MTGPSDLPAQASDLLKLAQRDRRAAQNAVAALSLDEQVELVCRTTPARRNELLELMPEPENVVPALPEAELVFTVKGIGRADTAWLLAYATDDQLRACVDLDAWNDLTPNRETLAEWIATFAEADDDTLTRGVQALDPELISLWLQDRCDVVMKPPDSEDQGWQPPGGGVTLDGQFYLISKRGGDDLDVATRLLTLLFDTDYWFYFRMLQSVAWEQPAENEEFALRWRAGRLQDLGFPTWEEAMAIYAHPRDDELSRLPDAAPPMGEWHLPVFMPELPAAADSKLSLFRAAALLDDEARRSFAYAFLALANQVAVAEKLPLGDAESIPAAIEKAAQVASRGLDALAERFAVEPVEVLRRAPLARLFRVGAHLDRAEAPS
jgi:hypothetical protein